MAATGGLACPFCKGAISADLAQYGGNCPHCMLEIPGDEAPTDPGAVLREKQEEERRQQEEAARRQRQRRNLGLTVVALALVAAGAWGWLQWQEQHTYQAASYFELPLEDIAAAPAPVEPSEPAAGPPATPGGKKPRAGTASSGGTAAGVMAGAPASGGAEDAAPVAIAAAGGSVSLGAGGNLGLVDNDQVLTDEAQIIEMIKRVLTGSSPQLEACYQQRLKQAPDLAGVWDVSFTVTTTGATAAVAVKGRTRKDPELEACLTRAVQGWRFLKIASNKPIAKPYRFGPSGF